MMKKRKEIGMWRGEKKKRKKMRKVKVGEV